jgi:hypothetical protein
MSLPVFDFSLGVIMKHLLTIAALILLATLAPITVMASPFSNNITMSDGNSSSGTEWYGLQEDNEVEPGMATGQAWDLEGFFLEGTTLTMVGGFNFKTGNPGYPDYTSGDIFIDIDGDAVYGGSGNQQSGQNIVANSFGYDYVLDLNFDTLTYDVYAIGKSAMVVTAYYGQNQGSSPWLYSSGGTPVNIDDHALTYSTELTNETVGFDGGLHNAVSVSLAFLQDDHHGTEFISHFTIGCGNDNLMGQGQLPAPEPATLVLMGFGLIGLAGLARKKISTP